MVAIDTVNLRYEQQALSPARAGISKGWSMRRQKLSPRYTTDADEMLRAKTWLRPETGQ